MATLPVYGVDPIGDSIASSIVQGEQAESRLRQEASLREAAKRLLGQAKRLDCQDLVAASRAAEPLVTAASLLSDGHVRMHAPAAGGVLARVLLVDAATVTGNESRIRARDLRAGGCDWVAVAIYERTRPYSDGLGTDPLFDEVVSL